MEKLVMIKIYSYTRVLNYFIIFFNNHEVEDLCAMKCGTRVCV